MTIAADPGERIAKGRPRRLLALGVLLALLGAAAGYFGMMQFGPQMPLPGLAAPQSVHPATDSRPAPAFVAIEPIIVTLPRASGREFLRFAATLEVEAGSQSDVTTILPRIVDVMNDYLRAVEPADFENRMILADLRAQLLRRIQVVTGEGRVTDLLVIEFILN